MDIKGPRIEIPDPYLVCNGSQELSSPGGFPCKAGGCSHRSGGWHFTRCPSSVVLHSSYSLRALANKNEPHKHWPFLFSYLSLKQCSFRCWECVHACEHAQNELTKHAVCLGLSAFPNKHGKRCGLEKIFHQLPVTQHLVSSFTVLLCKCQLKESVSSLSLISCMLDSNRLKTPSLLNKLITSLKGQGTFL